MQQVHHENMSQFIGAVIEPKNNFVVTEYCSKGSLQVTHIEREEGEGEGGEREETERGGDRERG